MSVCSVAVGFLTFIAVVHILVSIALGALIALVCYYGQMKRKATVQRDTYDRQRSRDLVELESPDKLYLSPPNRQTNSEDTPPFPSSLLDRPELSSGSTKDEEEKQDLGIFPNQWAVSDTDFSTEDLRRESIDHPTELSTSVDGSHVDGAVLRKRSRISMISIASNLSNRFRKSVDLDAEDALRLMRERSSSERDSTERDTLDQDTGLVMEVDTKTNDEQSSQRYSTAQQPTVGTLTFINKDKVELDAPADESQC